MRPRLGELSAGSSRTPWADVVECNRRALEKPSQSITSSVAARRVRGEVSFRHVCYLQRTPQTFRGALTQQSPRRLIDQRMPQAFRVS